MKTLSYFLLASFIIASFLNSITASYLYSHAEYRLDIAVFALCLIAVRIGERR